MIERASCTQTDLSGYVLSDAGGSNTDWNGRVTPFSFSRMFLLLLQYLDVLLLI